MHMPERVPILAAVLGVFATGTAAHALPGFRINANSMCADSLRSRYRYTEHEAPFALIADLIGAAELARKDRSPFRNRSLLARPE